MKNNQELKNVLGKPVVFLGMMGCGKSYVSKFFAKELGFDHFEMDEIIEEAQGYSIPVIFETYGETHFRLLETELLVNLLRGQEKCVISSGGGIVGRSENLAAIRDMAVSVWLKVDTPILLERVNNGEGRPMLLKDGDPAGALQRLLDEREPLYSQADIHIDNNGDESIEVLTDRIIEAIIAHCGKENS